MNERVRILLQVIDRTGGRLQKTGRDLDKLQKRSQKFAKEYGAALRVLAAGAAVLAVGSIKAASDLEESINAVNVTFGKASGAIHDFGQISVEQAGLSTRAFNDLAVRTGAVLTNFGSTQAEAAKQTVELTKRAGDLASVYNTSVEQAFSALNQAIRGETEAIRAFGGDVTDATLQAHLFAKGLDTKVTSLTQAEKVQLRYNVILQQTAKVEGDFVNTADSLANTCLLYTSPSPRD